MFMKYKYIIYIVSAIVGFSIGILVNWTSFTKPEESVTEIEFASYNKKKAIVEKGDTIAYKHVVDSIKTNYPNCGNYFYYSLVMVLAYDYAPANYDIYTALHDLYSSSNKAEQIDDKTKQLALFFLENGAKKGNKECINKLNELKMSEK